jgi:hypothetical protein
VAVEVGKGLFHETAQLYGGYNAVH